MTSPSNQPPNTSESAEVPSDSAPSHPSTATQTQSNTTSSTTNLPPASSSNTSPSNLQATTPAESPNAQPTSQQNNPSPPNPDRSITTQEDFDNWLDTVRERRRSFNAQEVESDVKKVEDDKDGGSWDFGENGGEDQDLEK